MLTDAESGNQYLGFTLDERASERRKTQVWNVRATRDYALLGTIKWFGRWRQYTFFPTEDTTFNPDCLRSIADFAALLTRRHRERRAA
jgi:hypothetical protein